MATLDQLLSRMEELLAAVEEFDEPAQQVVFELLDGVDALHRLALTELADDLGADVLDRLRAKDDPVITWLLDSYGMGVDQMAAAERALETIRPYIHSHGGRVELLGAEQGMVRLRMAGSCAGCSASAVTLAEGIEEALREHMPGFVGIEVEEEQAEPHAPPGPTLLQIQPGPPDAWH